MKANLKKTINISLRIYYNILIDTCYTFIFLYLFQYKYKFTK